VINIRVYSLRIVYQYYSNDIGTLDVSVIVLTVITISYTT
jgi:hypothetical protein